MLKLSKVSDVYKYLVVSQSLAVNDITTVYKNTQINKTNRFPW